MMAPKPDAPGARTDAELIARIRSLIPSLQPAEQQVAQVLADRAHEVPALSSTQLAELADCSRATVVRACRSLGFTGYSHLRVRFAAITPGQAAEAVERPQHRSSAHQLVVEAFDRAATSAAAMSALLDPAEVDASVAAITTARRVVVAGSGLSGSLAMQLADRLLSVGIFTAIRDDPIQQVVLASALEPGDVVIVVSGSGANRTAMRVAEAAAASGATVIAITSFERSPLALAADHVLLAGQQNGGFVKELTETSRVPLAILVEGLVPAIAAQLGERATTAADRVLAAIDENLAE